MRPPSAKLPGVTEKGKKRKNVRLTSSREANVLLYINRRGDAEQASGQGKGSGEED